MDAANTIANAKPIAQKSFLQKLGPGLITGAADDDPSGIATYSQVGAQFGAEPGASDEDAACVAVNEVRGLRSRLGMPGDLGQLGLHETMVDGLAQGALDDIVLANNPIQPTFERLAALVRSLL